MTLIKAKILDSVFNPYDELKSYQQRIPLGKCGATANFIGWMRDNNEGETVTGMWLEHYPQMTENYLQSIAETATEKWAISDGLLIHRVGQIELNEAIVLVAVWSAHRQNAFAACQFMLKELKFKAPFWKKETFPSGTRWVKQNTPSDHSKKD